MVKLDFTTVAPAPVSYGRARRRRRRTGVARRLWSLVEVAEKYNTTYNALLMQVSRGVLPVVVIPTALDRDATRRRLVVPDVWLENGRWYAMAAHEPGDAPIYTSRQSFRRPGDALMFSVEVAAMACGISQRHAYMLIEADRFCATEQIPGRRGVAIRLDALDAWVHALVHDTETRWYEGITQRGRAAS